MDMSVCHFDMPSGCLSRIFMPSRGKYYTYTENENENTHPGILNIELLIFGSNEQPEKSVLGVVLNNYIFRTTN